MVKYLQQYYSEYLPPEPAPVETVLNETNSTISPTKQPTANTTDVPFVAVNSLQLILYHLQIHQ